ncbi:MAG TPA: GTP-binding protein [Ktedonobacterales bacterium]|nr:GTP-binding protein [Ktedonobacterales bacterium]
MADTPRSETNAKKTSRFNLNPRGLFSFSTLAGIPSNLAMARKFMNAVNWKFAQEEIAGELRRKVAIIGLANSGKSTLFNTLQGRYVSPVSPIEGTTTTNVRGSFGPFTLIDTPGHIPEMQQEAIEEAAVTIYLLDAGEGMRPHDYQMVERLHKMEKSFVVTLNKSDLIGDMADEAAARAAARLHVQDVIPISARDGANVGEELIPALINASPEAAIVLGRQLPRFRREAANKLVRSATLIGLAAGLEPIPLVDIPILLGNQIRLVLRIAAVYGEPITAQHLRELVTTIASGLLMRYLAEEAAKAMPFGGDLVAGAIAAAGTWAIGQVAIEYFESGKKLSRSQINEMFKRYYRRYRETGQEEKLLPPPALPAATPEV